MKAVHMVSGHENNPGEASITEDPYAESVSFEECLQNSMDAKFTQLQDDLRFRRCSNISDKTAQMVISGSQLWRDELAENRQAPIFSRNPEASWFGPLAAFANDDANTSDANETSLPLYSYISRRVSESYPTSSSFSKLLDPTINDNYFRSSSSAPLQSFNFLRKPDIHHPLGSNWSFNIKHKENQFNEHKRGNNVFLKILATQLVSGTIIGRGGKGLNWFRRKSRVDDIMISMPWELYPKTEYRTLFLKGNTKAVVKATCIIADLMLSKYNTQYSTTSAASDRMIVLVVLPIFFKNAMEKIRDVCNPELISITLFHSSEEHKEIVAVLKGVKNQVKDLIATIANSIAETLEFKDYCHVAYPGPDGIDVSLMPKDKIMSSGNILEYEKPKEERDSNNNLIFRAKTDPGAHHTLEQRSQGRSEHLDTDVETDEMHSADSNEHMNTIEELLGFEGTQGTSLSGPFSETVAIASLMLASI
ncbi:hypothetical protein BgAZ_110380 [Babesia gibsoni]|uniref:K Homology domain-containing protein n=1 Tax=Babesia gibsoni TaxID=33632 RepID=A0AAD8PH90_BABGI|nr:hypothetical protein BgAZ_110380 [Babesia gibsoni]